MPRKFFEINTSEVCRVFSGEEEFDDTNESSDSTALFLRKFYAIFITKSELSECKKQLIQSSHQRNIHPDSRNLSKWYCEQCGVTFPTSYIHNRHMHHKHNDTTDLKKKSALVGHHKEMNRMVLNASVLQEGANLEPLLWIRPF
jgi:hypothetical protein